MNPVIAVFRRWDDGGILALFPEYPADPFGRFCESYMHVGQHAAADYHGVVQRTSPAKPSEYVELAIELTRIGYEVRPVMRASSRHHERRRSEARRFRSTDTR